MCVPVHMVSRRWTTFRNRVDLHVHGDVMWVMGTVCSGRAVPLSVWGFALTLFCVCSPVLLYRALGVNPNHEFTDSDMYRIVPN